MAHDVFISYASSDRSVANAVCSQLESIHRVRCWIAPRDITPGASWAESIIDALDTAKIMVLIFSSSANASMQIEREVERAVHKGIHIIPLRIEDATPTKTLEYFISAPHWLDALSTPMEEHIDKLAVSVKALLAKGAHARPAVAETHALPASASTTPVPAPRAAAPAAAPTATRERSWAFPALAGAAIAGLVAVIAYQFMVPRAPQSSAPEATDAPAATSAPAVAPPPQSPAAQPAAQPSTTTTTAASPATPPAAASNAATGTTPNASTAASRAAGAAASATAAAAVSAKTSAATATGKPNLFIDFRNPIDEGTIAVAIDGQQRWSASLAPPPPDAAGKRGQPPEVLTQALSVPPGDHKVEIQLLHADGRVRERRDLSMRLEPEQPRTMRIRLSRFKRDLQVAMVAGALPTTDTADAKVAETKESQATAAQAKTTASSAAAAKTPATAKPAPTAQAPAAKAPVSKEK